MSWTQRIDQRARRLNRWGRRHPFLAGLLIAALLALAVTVRWLRYNEDAENIPWIWAIVFTIATPICMLAAWRAGRRLRIRTASGATNVKASGDQFDLVAAEGELQFDGDGWTRARSLLLELVPAKRATLIGDPPRRIRVEPWGVPEVAPDVLARLEALAGVNLRVETRRLTSATPQGARHRDV